MPTLYTQKEKNIRKTFIYMTGFFVFVIFIGFIFAQALGSPNILYIAFIFALFMNFLSYWYSDKIVLTMYGARQIKKKDNPELHRIVENLCISAGLPVPKIYVIPDLSPNAFATGRNPKNASIAFTEGIIKLLDKRELEGVCAHELAHIGNRDILLSTIIVVLVGFVAILADLFLRFTFWGFGSRHSRNQNPIIFILAIIAAILAPIAATLIQLAISRKREFLADATGALTTRDPEGLASALEKIASSSIPMRRINHATAHLFIYSPLKQEEKNSRTSWFAKLFMTHPPIEERIKALRGMEI